MNTKSVDWPIVEAQAYGGVLLRASGDILLREPTNHFDGYVWTFPKGKPDSEETSEATARREVLEETGYQVEIVGVLPGVFCSGLSSNAYYIMRPVGTQSPPGWETQRTQWVDFDTAATLIAKTTNAKGRERDLAVLAAAQTWFKSNHTPENPKIWRYVTENRISYHFILNMNQKIKVFTWKEAINVVLEQFPGGLHYNKIADSIIEQGLRQTVGATPAATVNAQIAASIKHDGTASPYVRLDKGIFSLKSSLSPIDGAYLAAESPHMVEQDEAEAQIIHSFGMYWRRDAVVWKNNPKLWGYNKEGASKVDLGGQRGIYLLHDGREVIYVGRSEDTIGKRLLAHTKDRLAFRWDRFSWFGLNAVAENGAIEPMPSSYSANNMIATLEAILIEAMEPRLNRQRGQDLGDSEYFQHEDTSLKNAKLMTDITSLLTKDHS